MIVKAHARAPDGLPLCGDRRPGLEFTDTPACRRCEWTAPRSELAGRVYLMRSDGLTLTEVAEVLGVSHPRVAFIEGRVVARIHATADAWQREGRLGPRAAPAQAAGGISRFLRSGRTG